MKSMNKDYKITVKMMRENLNKIKGNSEINFDFLDSLESFKNVTTWSSAIEKLLIKSKEMFKVPSKYRIHSSITIFVFDFFQ